MINKKNNYNYTYSLEYFPIHDKIIGYILMTIFVFLGLGFSAGY